MKYDYPKFGKELGELVAAKQKAYGDSYGKSGNMLRILFPDGIPVDKYDDLLAIVRIIDKIFRVCNEKDYGSESPYRDISGYGLLRYVEEEMSKPSTKLEPDKLPSPKTRLDEVENIHDCKLYPGKVTAKNLSNCKCGYCNDVNDTRYR